MSPADASPFRLSVIFVFLDGHFPVVRWPCCWCAVAICCMGFWALWEDRVSRLFSRPLQVWEEGAEGTARWHMTRGKQRTDGVFRQNSMVLRGRVSRSAIPAFPRAVDHVHDVSSLQFLPTHLDMRNIMWQFRGCLAFATECLACRLERSADLVSHVSRNTWR